PRPYSTLFRSTVGHSHAVAMLQRFRTPTAIARPHPLGLPIAQPQQLRRLLQPQAARLYPPHDLDTTQLFAAQSTSPQSECLLSKHSKGVISNVVSRGHF